MVNDSQNATLGTPAVGGYTIPAINGQENRSNLFLLDGINNDETTRNAYAIQPILDDIKEFEVESHNDSVQFGGATGAVVNLVTKSGTNQFHSTFWEFLRNTSLDADPSGSTGITPYTQNQFGGNVGGPVILPHYNGRNKTFFFFGMEQFVNHTAAQSKFLEPTAAMWQGDFSGVSQTIYNAFSTVADPNNAGKYLRTAFIGNQIPSTLIDKNMQAFEALYPGQVNTGLAGTNAMVVAPSVTDSLGYDVRVDEQLGSKDSIWFRLSRFRVFSESPLQLIGSGSFVTYPAHDWGMNWLHVFSPTLVLQAQFGRVYGYESSGNTISGAPNITAGFASSFACAFYGTQHCLIPTFSMTGYQGGGESVTDLGQEDVYLGKANLSWIHGKHSMDMGGEIATNNFTKVTANDTIGFSPFNTENLETSSGGNAVASFLLGVPISAQLRNQRNNMIDGYVDSFYFQERWKAAKHLTVNLGIRYDVTFLPILGPSPTLTQNSGVMNFTTGNYVLNKAASSLGSCATLGAAPCIPNGVLPAHVVTSNTDTMINNDYSDIQPRIGFAYALNDKTAIRGFYGIFTDNWADMTQMVQTFGGVWPSTALTSVNNLNSTLPTVTAESPISSGSMPAATPFGSTLGGEDPNIKNPYSEQWTFGVERQVSRTTLLTVNYVGSHSTRLFCCNMWNTAFQPGSGSVQSRAPFSYALPANYNWSNGWAFYDGLQVSINRRAGQGLSYLLSYTWSKTMNAGADSYYAGGTVQNPYDLRSAYSEAGFDLTHILVASWVYELPFGKGRRFASGNRGLDYVVGGWQLNGMFSDHSGTPYTVLFSGDAANTGNTTQLVNIVGNPYSTTGPGLNTASFQAPATYTWGNERRNWLRTPGSHGSDMSVFRNFAITESKSLQFRAEAFNALNLTFWPGPNSVLNGQNFGQVSGKVGGGRQIQFALKLYF